MGISSDLVDLAARNDAFKHYLDTLRAQLDSQAAGDRNTLDTNLRVFYDHNGFHDAVLLVTGTESQIQLTGTFSTDDLKRSLEGAGVANSPARVVLADSGLSLTELWPLDVTRILDVIDGMVPDLSSANATSFSTAYRTAPLGFGQQLFVVVAMSTRQSPDFFFGKPLTLAQVTYEVRVSAEQAKSEVTMGVLTAYVAMQTEIEGKLAALAEDFTANRIDLDTYRKREQALQHVLDELQRVIDSLRASPAHA